MLAKIAAVAHSKVALAVLGVVLVGGSGAAVASAAATGHLSTLGINLNDASKGGASDTHAHTTGIEGTLTACNVAQNNIVVKDKDGKSWTIVITADTKLNGDVHSSSGASTGKGDTTGDTHAGAGSTNGASSDHGGGSTNGDSHTGGGSTNGDTHAGGASSKGDSTGDASSADKGSGSGSDHGASSVTLTQFCAAATLNVSGVQAQVTKNGSAYDAWKVTLQGQNGSNSSDGAGDGSAGGSSTGASSQKPDPTESTTSN